MKERILLIAILVTLLVIRLGTAKASAETVGQLMNASCAQAQTAERYEEEARDSRNVGDGISVYGPLFRASARIYYFCAKETTNMEAHDWYRFYYASDLWLSSYSEEVASIARSTANELAADTQFPNVREAALKLRDRIGSPAALP